MRNFFLPFLVLALTACAPQLDSLPPTDDPSTITTELPLPANTMPPSNTTPEFIQNQFSPKPADSDMVRSGAFLDVSQLNIMESFPIQVGLSLEGSLPTPCHQLRVLISVPDAFNTIQVHVYSVVSPDKICIQVLEPFQANFNLGSFPAGHYTVFLNEELLAEFDSP